MFRSERMDSELFESFSSSTFGEDWNDDSPGEQIRNDYKIDLKLLNRRREAREPEENNLKRKKCYQKSNNIDDGYGVCLSFRQQQNERKFNLRVNNQNSNNSNSSYIQKAIFNPKARGKRFKTNGDAARGNQFSSEDSLQSEEDMEIANVLSCRFENKLKINS